MRKKLFKIIGAALLFATIGLTSFGLPIQQTSKITKTTKIEKPVLNPGQIKVPVARCKC